MGFNTFEENSMIKLVAFGEERVKFNYHCNYNGWSVEDEDGLLTDDQVTELEDELPDLTWQLHDEDGYNEDGLWGEEETKVNEYIKSILGDIKYKINEDFTSS